MDAVREIILPVVYLVLNVAHAYWHAKRIKKGELILSKKKIAEAIISNVVVFLVVIFFYPFWPVILFAGLTRAAFYDIALNLFRGKRWTYEGDISRKKSWMDWIEYEIGFPPYVYRVLYLAVYVTYLIIYLI